MARIFDLCNFLSLKLTATPYTDNYLTAVPNRTEFPLHGGFISFSSGHPHWTCACLHSPRGHTYPLTSIYLVGVILSTAENSTNFANFTQAVDFFSGDLPGNICFPVDFGNTNISGLHDGANVTVQMVFDAGDGKLYQVCAISARTIPHTVPQLNVHLLFTVC